MTKFSVFYNSKYQHKVELPDSDPIPLTRRREMRNWGHDNCEAGFTSLHAGKRHFFESKDDAFRFKMAFGGTYSFVEKDGDKEGKQL